MTVPELAGWPALVLTAGLATRLRPLSDIRAKAALPVAGQPLIGRILRWLHDSGVREVVLNLHHYAMDAAVWRSQGAHLRRLVPQADASHVACDDRQAELTA